MKKVVILSGALLMVFLLASCGIKENTGSSEIDSVTQESQNIAAVTTTGEEVMEKSIESEDTMMDKDDEAMMDDDYNADKMMDKSDDSMEKMEDDVMMNKEDEAIQAELVTTKELAGIYAEYDSSLLGTTEDTVIFFYAAWCPSCRAADDVISEETIPDGLTLLKANYDEETALKKKYGVTGQHTFVQVDADGNEIKKWLG
jgi:hypothetical protein